MSQEKKYNPKKSESLSQQFNRFKSRMKRRWNGEQVMLEDINTIKLPAVDSMRHRYALEPSYFATRNAGGKWNVEQQENWGGEYLFQKTIATDLDLPELLDFLAEKNPASMKQDTTKYWHPASVALLIGHEFKKDRKKQPPAPKTNP